MSSQRALKEEPVDLEGQVLVCLSLVDIREVSMYPSSRVRWCNLDHWDNLELVVSSSPNTELFNAIVIQVRVDVVSMKS